MPGATVDKLILTNCEVLTNKYGAAGTNRVKSAVKALIAADAKRGIIADWVDLGDATAMSTYGLPPIPASQAGDPRRNKEAVDQIYQHGAVRPSYLMLLGSTDVIPHIPLDNIAQDEDASIPSDLPYACDKPFGTDVQDFIAPTRVVGRLPNVTHDQDAAYLVGLLGTAASYTPRPVTKYTGFLALSAHVWKVSTELSLDAVFGVRAGLKLSPPTSHKFTAADAKPLTHFVNCHGAPGDPNFYGQKGASFPIALSAAWMANKVPEGAVMAAECCYGAELYDPSLESAQGQPGLCNTYLGRAAYAFFGSTNIAYGPADANDNADLICQYFFNHLGAGASAGRACLQARLDYVLGKGGVLTPIDLKTLAQFTLLGDPSLTPVESTRQEVIPIAKTKAADALESVERHSRLSRRASLVAQSTAVAAFRLQEPAAPPGAGKSGVFGKLRKLAADHGITDPDVQLTYAIGGVVQPEGVGAKSVAFAADVAGPGPKAVHTILQKTPPPKSAPNVTLVRGVEAVEYADGMNVRVFVSR